MSSATFATRAQHWAEMIKLGHSIFALPYALLAAFMASRGAPRWEHLVLIVACMVGARSAAMTFNRIVDAQIDARNPRTAQRQLPRGLISRHDAWLFFAASCLFFAAGCAGFWLLDRNPWPLLLSVPTLAWLCFYSYTKRLTRWSHLVLGAAIAFSPVAAWIAIAPASLGWPAALLMAAVTFWIAGFDIIYACQDADFDRRSGLHSLPAALGVRSALHVARAFHTLTVLALVATGIIAGMGWLYFTGVACVALLLTVENAIVRHDDLSRVNLAFFTINGLVSVLLGVLGAADVLLRSGAAG